jgi:EAL domain-containing protein (putative c-di-GMP-specific phosphodiesterase class I)
VDEGTVLATGSRPHSAQRGADVAWRDLIGEILAGRDAVRLVYPPIVDLVTGATVGYEPLARFHGPVLADRHDIPPSASSPST